MQVSAVKIDKNEAEKKYKEYLEVIKTRKAKEYNALRRAYRALSKGYKVIDIYKAFEDTGCDSNYRPKLAIVRADSKMVYFTKLRDGAGRFTHYNPTDWSNRKYAGEVLLPENTFAEWQYGTDRWRGIIEPNLQANVPIIPAYIALPKNLENTYILFEVDKWSRTASTRDPFLLERLNNNTFIVLAEWDVSDVEAIVMRGIVPNG